MAGNISATRTGDRDLDAWVASMLAMNRDADRATRHLSRHERTVAATIRNGGSRWDVPYPVPRGFVVPKRYVPTIDQVGSLTRTRDTVSGRFLPGPRPHGTIARYQRGEGQDGCRCPDCCDAWRTYFRNKMRERYWAKKRPPDEPEPAPMTAAERFVADYRAQQERLNASHHLSSPV
jgi:hypothetical protein